MILLWGHWTATGKGMRKKRGDGPEGGGPGLQVPVASKSSWSGAWAGPVLGRTEFVVR